MTAKSEKSDITLIGVEANFNNLWGASLDGLSVFVVNSKFKNNVSDSSQFIDDTGLIVNSRGDFVLLENVEAKENRLLGATITAVGDVYVVRSTFTGNAGVTCSLSWCPAGSQINHGYGLKVVTPGLVYLDGVNASDNNLFGATLEGSTVTVLNSTFNNKLRHYGERVALVAITGASNVTGYLIPIHRLAQKAHEIGAQFLADCAQFAPHRKIDMLPMEDPGHLDYVAISAHKLYAPFGTGALVGIRSTFERGDPDLTGGGTVEIVTLDDVVWANPPDREEAGSPNTIGAIALAAAIYQLERIGMESIASHEAELTAYALDKLAQIPNTKIFGDSNPDKANDRLVVIPFQIEGYSHFLVSAILGYEFGIGVRSGCFCAHPYILHLLGLSSEQALKVRQRMMAGDKSDMPGMVRISFGLYNTKADVDDLVDALWQISRGNYVGDLSLVLYRTMPISSPW